MCDLDYGIVTTDPEGVAPLVSPATTGTANSLEEKETFEESA
jgi:hypothetical protein